MIWYSVSLDFRTTSILGRWRRGRSEVSERGKSSRRVSPLYFHSLASYLFLWGFLPPPSLSFLPSCRGSPRILEERTTSSDSRTRGERSTAGALWPSLLSSPVPARRYPQRRGRETPCPLNGVTGLPWLPGTPWKQRHRRRRTQRKAHLFWKNIIRTRARAASRPAGHLASLCPCTRLASVLARVHTQDCASFFQKATEVAEK